ncbi:HET-domain-containing protein [Zopfia rhizophila CBS 207.26]|uniref:HET-domain-containing protein n=1 Tax=Zopfia rhizophila CBS 207.26 TaxID=1314779 RepID=A0A6A6ENY6_9PEZI|nr:HET-domain-containing protein [Zopfia rhizophila CBS 207.26]
MANRFCEKCIAFQQWPASTAEIWYRSARFPHWSTGTALETAAANGCHLCKLMRRALLKSERPDGETSLPDRQIYLSLALVDLAGRGLRIDVRIEPESLETAGRPKLDGAMKPGYSIVPEDAKNIMSGMGVDQFWIVDCEDGYEYYSGNREVSEAEFWALVNPYYAAQVELFPYKEQISAMLERCSALPDGSTGSDASVHLALSWLKTCMKEHKACKQFGGLVSDLPTRVVDVGPSDGTIPPRLYVSRPGQKAIYLTLSHRWGTSQICKTTKRRLEDFQRQLPMNELTDTFKDAIKITQKFGFRYLWIDSLCIVQDDEVDWRSEAPKMGAIYRHGILNLAAIDSDTQGCFRDRDGAVNRPCKINIKFPEKYIPVGHGGPIHAVAPPNLGPKKPSQGYRGPLDTRAWVLQEYILSCRTLNFGKKMISWSCPSMMASETLPEGAKLGDIGINDAGSFVQEFQNGLSGMKTQSKDAESKERPVFERSWFLTVEAYTRRDITFQTDRLTALAGLATQYKEAAGDEYLAGIWKENILDGLLWSVWARGCPSVSNTAAQKGDHGPYGERYTEFQAPSFSWASIKGFIRYFEQYAQDERVGQMHIAEVVDASVSPSHPSIVSYSYTGSVTLRSRLCKAIAVAANPFSIDWEIQRQSSVALEMTHAARKMEEMRSKPLSTTIAPKKDKEKTGSSELTDSPPAETSHPEPHQSDPSQLESNAPSDPHFTSPPAPKPDSRTSTPKPSSALNRNTSAPEPISASSTESSTPTSNPALLRQPSFTSFPTDLPREYLQAIDIPELLSSFSIRGDSVGIDARVLQRIGERAIDRADPQPSGAAMRVIDQQNITAATWPVHTLADMGGKTIGLWAPDVSDELGLSVGRRKILCLVIARRRRFVWCLGLVQNGEDVGEDVDENSKEYTRVGLAYINVEDYDNMDEKPVVTVKIV